MSILADGNKTDLSINDIRIVGQKGGGVYRVLLIVKTLLSIWQEKSYSVINLEGNLFIKEPGTNQNIYRKGIP